MTQSTTVSLVADTWQQLTNADTTPTSLPDLSATNFQIATTGIFNIESLRVWGNDIEQAGIVEATT